MVLLCQIIGCPYKDSFEAIIHLVLIYTLYVYIHHDVVMTLSCCEILCILYGFIIGTNNNTVRMRVSLLIFMYIPIATYKSCSASHSQLTCLPIMTVAL